MLERWDIGLDRLLLAVEMPRFHHLPIVGGLRQLDDLQPAQVGLQFFAGLFQDTVSVRSPGVPLAPATLEQMQAFTAPMYNRNPKLQFAFGGTKLVEGRGFGMRTFGAVAKKHGLPLPKYSWDAPYLTLTLYRSPRGVVKNLRIEILGRLNADEEVTWQFILSRPSTTSPELMTTTGFDERKTQRILKKLLNAGLVRRLGKGRATQYQAIQP